MKFYDTMAKVGIFIITLLVTFSSTAQTTGISPYSRFGLGSLNNFHSPAYRSMGGSSVALSDFNQLNISNPASYSFLEENRPVFEGDFYVQYLKLQVLDAENNTVKSGNQLNSNLARFSLGLPASKRIGFGISLLPYSMSGYNITSTDSVSTLGTVNYLYNGSGGLNKGNFGISYKLLDKDSVEFSIGAEASYLFGGISREKRTEFPDDDASIYALVSDKTIIKGFVFGGGFIFKNKIAKNVKLQLGVSFETGSVLNASRDILNATYDNDLIAQRNIDTISYSTNNKGTITIPLEYKAGFALNFNDKITLSTQYQAQDWKNYHESFTTSNQPSDSLTSASQFSVGLRYRPIDIFTSSSFFNHIEYRLGARTGQTAFQYNGTNVKEFGMSFGIGIPVAVSTATRINYKSVSMIQLGVEYGSRGTTNNGLIKEDYTRLYFGISIMPAKGDRWFRKRKIE